MTASAPLLRMNNVNKHFGATRALKNVSFSVQAGRVLALIGENGAGKSTLMKVLSGAHRPDSGVSSPLAAGIGRCRRRSGLPGVRS